TADRASRVPAAGGRSRATRGSADTYLSKHRGCPPGAAAFADRAGVARSRDLGRARLDPRGHAAKTRAALAHRRVDDDASAATRCAPAGIAGRASSGAAAAGVRRTAGAPAHAAPA